MDDDSIDDDDDDDDFVVERIRELSVAVVDVVEESAHCR